MTLPSFPETLQVHQLRVFHQSTEVLQVNIGRRCNQACLHCHVEAGPNRPENMSEATIHRLLELLSGAPHIRTVDITGGAPELHPHFRSFVSKVRAMGKEVMDRCNLTVLLESGQEDTAHFLREQQVHVVASLPCYSQENVERQRGRGVFEKSITVLQELNALGYGKPDFRLPLDLVYNPVGAFLPGDQKVLEAEYKEKLYLEYGIEFHRLLAITNMPIKRFLHDLERTGKLTEYMELLLNSFNPTAAENLMCRKMFSISWDGKLFNCDFNQMLELHVDGKSIWNIRSLAELENSEIRLGNHCYGCTAGAGSSCTGSLVSSRRP